MAEDKVKSIRVVSEGGLDTTRNYLNLSENKPGSAIRLINFEPSPAGGYRRIDGYAPFDAAYPEPGIGVGQGKVLGLIIFENDVTRTTEFYAMRRLTASPTQYKIYKYVALSGWVEVVTGLTHYYSIGTNIVDKIRYDIGNDGNVNHLAIVDGVNQALLFDGTTWAFVSTLNTGASMALAGGAQAIDAPNVVAFFSQTLFLACDVKNLHTGQVVYSAPNAFYDFTSASGAGQVVAGVYVVDIKPFRDTLYIFGYNRIKKLLADVTAGFLISDVTANMGLLARDGIVEIGGDLMFLGPDGIRPIQGTDKIGDVQLETISKPIQKLIVDRTVGLADLNVNPVVIRSKSQFRFFFGDDSTYAIDSRGVIGALRQSSQQTGWEFSETLGIRCSVATSRYVGGTEYVLFGDYDGKVYRMENNAADFNGNDIVAVYTTPYLDMGDTQTRKLMQEISAFIIGEGNTITVTLGLSYDWGNSDTTNPASYEMVALSTTPTYGGGFTYGGGSVYGGSLFPVIRTPAEGSFYSVSLTFSTSGAEAPYSILGFILEFQAEAMR